MTEKSEPAKNSSSLLTRRALAAAFDVHMQTITKWERDGLPIAERGRKGQPSRYRLPECVQWFIRRELQARGAGEGSADLSPQQERARLDQKRREELDLRLAVRRGELVGRAAVEAEFADLAVAVKAKIRALPDAVADQVVGLRPAAARALLLARIDDVLRELARGDDIVTDLEATDEPQTTASVEAHS